MYAPFGFNGADCTISNLLPPSSILRHGARPASPTATAGSTSSRRLALAQPADDRVRKTKIVDAVAKAQQRVDIADEGEHAHEAAFIAVQIGQDAEFHGSSPHRSGLPVGPACALRQWYTGKTPARSGRCDRQWRASSTTRRRTCAAR